MVTIIGSGIGERNFSKIDVDLNSFDVIVCDKSFKEKRDNLLKLPLKDAKEFILKNENKNIAYIVSGSPLFYSAASFICQKIKNCKIINNTSSLEYLLLKLKIPFQKVSTLSLHGRDRSDLNELLKREYTFILCDKDSVSKLRRDLYWVRDKIETYLGYKMGYLDEEIKKIDLFRDDFDTKEPHVLLIKRDFDRKDSSLDDEDFEKERGMITKKYKRELTLSHLELSSNLLLWDVGAGSGSCSIEAFVRFKTRSILFEKNPKRVEMIKRNLEKHNVLAAEVVEGRAEDFFEKKSSPDRILIGGGGEEVIRKIPFLFDILNEKGIILINLISLRHLALAILILQEAKIDYEVISLSLTTYKGYLKMSEPERELFWIKIRK